MNRMKKHAKRVVLESLGWILIALGLAALVLPGPGLLMLFAGLALLALQYEWAERRVHPIRQAALKTAAESVKSWPRIILSVALSLGLVGIGICWGIHPPAPLWWPLADKWWLAGGWGTGGTIIGSGTIALITIGYSFWAFRTRQPKHKQ